MVKPADIVNLYIDTSTNLFYADVGLVDLKLAGFVISSGTLLNGALVHSSLAVLDEDDHPQYILADGTRAFSSTVSGVSPIANAHLATKLYVDTISGSLSAGLGHARYTGAENDAIVGGANITVVSGSNIITISSVGGGTVSNSLIGADGITVTSGVSQDTITGHTRYTQAENDALVGGTNVTVVSGVDTITISSIGGGGGVANSLIGADGITVTSGVSQDTITGFRAEFINASGTLSAEIDSDIATHAAIADAHHAKYTDAEAITALEPTTSALAASGVALQSQIDAIDIDEVEPAITGSDGITITSGTSTTDVVGFRTEFVNASGTLQTSIDSRRTKFQEPVAFTEQTFQHNLNEEHVTVTIYDFIGNCLTIGADSICASGVNHTTVVNNPAASGIYIFSI